MTLAQSAYDLLMMIALTDGILHEQEKVIMRAYASQNFEEEIDFEQEEREMMHMDEEDLMDRFEAAATFYMENGRNEDRISLLLTALEVVHADQEFSEGEEKFFKGLANVWNINWEAVMAHFKQQHKTATA